ncbi:hypothetical protein IV500_00785 [Paeniglutamicibacter antarcticus]|uniref:Uncharacterized protein n=1 Tax=Arthrobacter terrae TaxID=2935737 RepID=A0A931CLC6_9MICC|nr:hypothetical protein [Arthrobacter terrae]MBG0737976.1 hypothetical protein [Arthrobacter terrae]
MASPAGADSAAAVKELQAALGAKECTDEKTRRARGHDVSAHEWSLPDAVVLCSSTADVALTQKVCLRHGVPAVPNGRARKSSAGYDPTGPFCRLRRNAGIITEATVRLYGIPERTATAAVSFRTVCSAVVAVSP